MNALVRRTIDQQEERLGVPLDYLRSLAGVSAGLFVKFGLTTPAATHRKHAPRDAWHLARLGATRVQDCGTCVQIVVNVALDDGVAPATLRAALNGRENALGAVERQALRFGEAVAARTGEVDALRAKLEARTSPEAVVELALAVALVQVYPILKRGLGQTTACSLVQIDVSGPPTG